MTTISVQINNERTAISRDISLANLLTHLGYQQPNIAVALNETFVPRSQYHTTQIQAGDSIEIVAPMQGG